MASDALSVLFPNVAVTRDIRVRVAVSYLAEQSNPQLNRWFWSYHIRIENGSDLSVQLLSRSWGSSMAEVQPTKCTAREWWARLR